MKFTIQDMARIDKFSGLSEFLAVADHASFRAAAAQLGVIRAAVSQAVRALEDRLGRRLFQRTTRSIALTDAGSQLLATLRPAADQIGHTLDQLAGDADRPVGHLRLTVPRIAVDLALAPVLPEFRSRFPEISIELNVDDASVDLASRHCDAGIRIGEWVERDMVAVKLTGGFSVDGRRGAGLPRTLRPASAATGPARSRMHPLSISDGRLRLPMGVRRGRRNFHSGCARSGDGQ